MRGRRCLGATSRNLLVAAVGGALLLLAPPPGATSTATSDNLTPPTIPIPGSDALGTLLGAGFSENAGQVGNRDVRFYTSSGSMDVGFIPSGVLFKLQERSPPARVDLLSTERAGLTDAEPLSTARGVLIRLTFEGANPIVPKGRGELPHRSHFFLGNDPAAWRTHVRSYSEVVYEGLYEGIDLVYRFGSEGLKYEFRLDPGADPTVIALSYEGADGLEVGETGDLRVHTLLGPVRDTAPVAYQGENLVPCAFALRSRLTSGFDCRGMDESRPLLIDPLVYAALLGGAGYDFGRSIAVSNGSAYVTGFTDSTDFPVTPGAFNTTGGSLGDAFVAKLSPAGSSLLYATYLGGAGYDIGRSIAVSNGSAYVTGFTDSTDFPVTPGAFNTTGGIAGDAFVAKLDPTGGSLLYSTYLGGVDWDVGFSIAVSTDHAYVTGETYSSDFPVTPGAFNTTGGIAGDAFVAKLDLTGGSLLHSTYLGGVNWDRAFSIAVSSGAAYVTGFTDSTDFPVTPGAFNTTGGTLGDAFVAKLDPTGGSLLYSTYLGGEDWDRGFSIAVSSGAAYVTGETLSIDFPVTSGAFNTTGGTGGDAFVAKLDPTGGSLLYSTYLGGVDWDVGFSIAVSSGAAYVTGGTFSTDFPVTPGAYDMGFDGVCDAFVAKLDPTGGSLLYSTYLGGGGGGDVAFSNAYSGGSAYVTGATDSIDFPVTPGAFNASSGGTGDVFVAKISIDALSGPPVANAGPDQMSVRNATVTLDGSASFDPDGDPITFNWTQVAGPNLLPIPDADTSVASVVPTMVGTYTFNLTVTDNRTESDSDWIDVVILNQGPIADAGPDQMTFENALVALDGSASVDPDGDLLAYNWTQTAGPQPVTLNGPDTAIASFTASNGAFASGVYIFSLRVTDPLGTNETDGTNVTVANRPPVADAGPDQNAAKFSNVTLNGSNSSDPDAEPITYFWWQTGGPSRVTLTTPFAAITNFTTAGAGIYTFDLFVYDPEGTNVSDSVSVSVANAAPTGNLTVTPNPLQTGALADVDARGSVDGDGTIVQYNFTFGDGSGSGNVTTSLVPHAWAAAGTYAVNVTVWDDEGASDTATVLVTVFVDDPPTAVAAVTPGTTGTLATLFSFDASASTDDHGVVRWLWDFGDGSTATTQVAAHTYATRSIFVVTLTVWDAFNQNDTDALTINVVNRPPIANAGPDQAGFLKGVVVTLDGTGSADPDGDPLSFSWTQIGGPIVIILANPNAATATFTPTIAGLYMLRLAVDDLDGGTDTDDVAVDVWNMAPVADLTADRLSALTGQTITFDGSVSTDPDGTIASWTLAFGDGNSANGGGPPTTAAHAYAAAGTYVATLTVTDDEGSTDDATLSVTITVDLPPDADAGPDQTGTLATTFSFDGSASADDQGIVAWRWDFGDGDTATTETATHLYATRATFTVTLTVWDAIDQFDTDTLTIGVGNRPPIANAGQDQDVLKRSLVTLDASLSSDPDPDTLSFAWFQVSGLAVSLTGPNTATPTFTPPTSGVYTFRVDVMDDNGGLSQDTVAVGAMNRPPTANAGPDQRTVIVGALVTLDGTLSSDPDGDPLTYTWTGISGPPSVTLTNANSATPAFAATAAGTYVFSLIVSDGTDASASDTVTIVVEPANPLTRVETVLLIVVILAILVLFGLFVLAAWRRRKKPEDEVEVGTREEIEDAGIGAEPRDGVAVEPKPREDEPEL
ncbi:MAG TPA: PKD domain-containing protein [Thermoplasmata archaeon]|uniref:PKD domain-containing protein n=1 Tax=uncultured euryarchaeote Rifle_16ft_4_minimus_37789 TaxID=1665195 RepID=A0A0H4TQ07_9EURY|nr:hypothetical protein [uncultured euryarchaeote Rifle_16ft_4_minimus_37789]HKZ62878.1 PKD domain-containing protein [Thermoplasmata archaeon]